jgi:hypothetical protein
VGNRVINTNWLTHARFEVTAPKLDRREWLIAGGALLLVLVVAGRGFAGDLYMSARDLAALRQERALLAADVARLRTELALESATREELERHASELNARVTELIGQVEFLRARRAPGKSTE